MKTKAETKMYGRDPLWKAHAGAASVDISAAIGTFTGEPDALEHLLDARGNIDKAIEALEETIEVMK